MYARHSGIPPEKYYNPLSVYNLTSLPLLKEVL